MPGFPEASYLKFVVAVAGAPRPLAALSGQRDLGRDLRGRVAASASASRSRSARPRARARRARRGCVDERRARHRERGQRDARIDEPLADAARRSARSRARAAGDRAQRRGAARRSRRRSSGGAADEAGDRAARSGGARRHAGPSASRRRGSRSRRRARAPSPCASTSALRCLRNSRNAIAVGSSIAGIVSIRSRAWRRSASPGASVPCTTGRPTAGSSAGAATAPHGGSLRRLDLVLLEPGLDVPVQQLGAIREPALALGGIGEQHVLEPAERALAVDRDDQALAQRLVGRPSRRTSPSSGTARATTPARRADSCGCSRETCCRLIVASGSPDVIVMTRPVDRSR